MQFPPGDILGLDLLFSFLSSSTFLELFRQPKHDPFISSRCQLHSFSCSSRCPLFRESAARSICNCAAVQFRTRSVLLIGKWTVQRFLLIIDRRYCRSFTHRIFQRSFGKASIVEHHSLEYTPPAMYSLHKLVVRDDSMSDGVLTPTVVNILMGLLGLIFLGLSLIACLFILRRSRKSKRQSELPLYNESTSKTSNHRRLTITASPYGRRSESVYVYSEKQTLMNSPASSPTSPIPEIRITFPEEEDDAGKRKSGRVVVVRIGETGVGLEPYQEDDLPPYQNGEAGKFQSLDLERIGGLKEREQGQRWS